jgi:S-DNA-T family DNA segregation ATPase FtsK/SpoIIIE
LQILALEGAIFSFLTLLSILGGQSLEQAEMGNDGGLIGWSLAGLLSRFILPPWSTLILFFLIVLFLSIGLGLHIFLSQILLKLANAENADVKVTASPISEKSPTKPEDAIKPERQYIQSQPNQRDKRLPPLNLLSQEQSIEPDEDQIRHSASIIEQTLAEFGIPASVKGYRVGPTITQFAVEPGFIEKSGAEGEIAHQKVRVSQISALQRDLALALSAERLRIEAPVPGRSFVGIEVPNPQSTIVRLRPLLESEPFQRLSSPLAIVLGKDVSGQPVVADLARMPHLLIAGTTGSGKSICIAAITTCLALNNTPGDLRMVLLDPKMVELARFNGLPHLLGKVETKLERMLAVLQWVLMEMDHRYRLLESAHTRDIETFNRRMEKKKQETLPRIVVIIDELADLMMSAPEQTEHSLVRLAQMARATGIHLVVATQRPSTDVVTGLIKANFPARISFSVASSVDSRVILDTPGAETLLGKGDMLFLNPESGTPLRAQGAWVTDVELERVIGYWAKNLPVDQTVAAPWEELVEAGQDENGDQLIERAKEIVCREGRASASFLQRRLRIGYPRAARLMDELEERGVVGPAQGSGKEREVLMSLNDADQDDSDSSDDDG